jgi:lipopolysaccharide export system permease protein
MLALKTLHSYLTRQILASFLMTVMVFTFVLMIANVLKEVLPLLISGQVRMGIAVQAIGLLIPFVWVFALPMGMLTATLLIFGRFSADQELTAVRASGVSTLSLTSPILLLSLALCGVAAIMNMEIGPRCRVAFTALRDKMRYEFISALVLPEGYTKDKDTIIYIGKNRRGELEDIIIYRSEGTNRDTEMTIHAARGKYEIENKTIKLHLVDAKMMRRSGTKIELPSSGSIDVEFSLDQKAKRAPSLSVSDMTFLQLREELSDLEARLNQPLRPGLTMDQLKAAKKALEKQRTELISPIRVHMHRQVAFSFACFGFTLVGIPLGIQVHRRETNIGIAIALLLVAVYYSFILVGQALDTRPELLPHLIVWMPNFLFQTVGAVMLWRANKGI